jgi:hypothetical protein
MEPNQRAERLEDMRRIAAIALIALATTGCIGSGSSVDTSAQGTTPKTEVVITYTVPTCPPGARCVQFPGTKSYMVSRPLTCSPAPAKGNYTDPAAACRALADIVTKQRQPQSRPVCQCAFVRGPKAVGYYHGKQRTIPLDGCSLCGLAGINADLTTLMPGAQG